MDRQKAALYAWEETFRCFNEHILTREETCKVIRRCCKQYSVGQPIVYFLSRDKLEWSSCHGTEIYLNYYHCNYASACHEAAHYILRLLDHEDDTEYHGPEFVCLYLDLLVREKVAPRSALEASLEQAGIEWTKPAR